MECYASCPMGFEDALAAELHSFGVSRVRKLRGRVSFDAEDEQLYRTCLWSRLASRVFWVLGRVDATNADTLYQDSLKIEWNKIIRRGATMSVTARGVNNELRNTHFTALRVKDAICDAMMDATGARPNIDTTWPDAHILVSIRNNKATLAFDMSGDALFKRLPKEATRPGSAHVLRPDYAALLLSRAGWYRACRANRPILVDLSCAGGGLLIEAAAQALDRAPGLLRERWGFEGWCGFNQELWYSILDEADDRYEKGEQKQLTIIASDTNKANLDLAKKIAHAARVDRYINFMEADAQAVTDALIEAQQGEDFTRGICVADTTEVSIARMPTLLGIIASVRSANATEAFTFTCLESNELISKSLNMKSAEAIAVKPNNEDACITVFTAPAQASVQGADKDSNAEVEEEDNSLEAIMPNAQMLDLGDKGQVSILVPQSDQFASRLKKVAKLRRKWANRNGVTCYRVYDADLPDYAVAIDLYQGSAATPGRWLVIAEYAPPKTIDRTLAEARMLDVISIAPRILDVEPDCVYTKSRIRAKGGSQYSKAVKKQESVVRNNPYIEEGGLTFEVNFTEYLDTGIFLDHRVTRDLVRQYAQGCHRFLNLFAYTGTATCYAADGGARETTSVDLSNTYLAWAKRNLQTNALEGERDEFVRADVMSWIDQERHTKHRWDLIFCDPPTFSNSSSMGRRTWDVQRDHVELLIGISRLLTREGKAIFSCNLQTFKPELEKLAVAGVVLQDITEQTIPEDFSRNKRIHKCYILTRTTPQKAQELLCNK